MLVSKNRYFQHFTLRLRRLGGAGLALLLSAIFGFGCGLEKKSSGEGESAPFTPETILTEGGHTMARIPAGTFLMGDDRGGADEGPARRVSISEFYMDIHEVTQESYEALMGQNPAKHKSPGHPVEQVGWYGAIRYCNMRSLREGLTPCYDLETLAIDFEADGYRLPTEAEWEYACRAGTDTAFSFGDGEGALGRFGWYEGNANKTTHPVGAKPANPWGLHDMHGNVAEWCNDTYGASYYGEAGALDPCNTTPGEERVLRGGSWDSPADSCRSAARYSEAPGLADVCFGYDAYGFRCVRRIPRDGAAEQ